MPARRLASDDSTAASVRSMFAAIAGTYDRANQVLVETTPCAFFTPPE